ncbi:MAG TPA: undecaprenyl-phosphate galactose phosphotransferase WbaP [Armatimonadota bacterium]|nr:undecaprenyl-phosphate galactose phosphotransferase WbaP [Armatimonadota bacterium]HOJ20206.1 undecaprenyl-phosphate galactose phosphotransferase WbaP [Armatimonadota bacterium]HPO74589.1 undecaprenyl-phosphate galactose phosphotransferase WbaP [Armatimonadota bacterium]HPT97270.1 undecaprenyl-phosphate galactose phosphotransferase WbaP [Armatimonadota bacterium]
MEEVTASQLIRIDEAEAQIAEAAAAARPRCTAVILALADLISLLAAWGISVSLAHLLHTGPTPDFYWALLPAAVIFLAVYAAFGLYPTVGHGPAEELKRTSLATTWAYTISATAAFLTRTEAPCPAGVIIAAWVLSLALVPICRSVARALYARQRWWGHPVVIFGAGRTGALIIRALRDCPDLGLNPIAVVDDDPARWGRLDGTPVVGPLEKAVTLAKAHSIRYAIVAMPGVARERLLSIIEQYGKPFRHVLVVPDLYGIASLWVVGRDLGGMLTLEVRRRRLMPIHKAIKRALDIVLVLLSSVVVLPIFALIALAVRLDSPGPILYGSIRIGRNGRRFTAWKFRSMVTNADEVIQEYLRQNPKEREEYERVHKLRQDPRVTRVGRFLRRTSLDELPQLWNVLLGDMSLVGPRPYAEYDFRDDNLEEFDLYYQVLPGLTGLWQVSGRAETTFAERIAFDNYYVRNWSLWLDLYILARTVWVVLFGRGAY